MLMSRTGGLTDVGHFLNEDDGVIFALHEIHVQV